MREPHPGPTSSFSGVDFGEDGDGEKREDDRVGKVDPLGAHEHHSTVVRFPRQQDGAPGQRFAVDQVIPMQLVENASEAITGPADDRPRKGGLPEIEPKTEHRLKDPVVVMQNTLEALANARLRPKPPTRLVDGAAREHQSGLEFASADGLK